MLNYADEEQKKVVLRCNGCGCPCGGATENEARERAAAEGWFEVPFGATEKRWYCESHPKPDADEERPGFRFGRR